MLIVSILSHLQRVASLLTQRSGIDTERPAKISPKNTFGFRLRVPLISPQLGAASATFNSLPGDSLHSQAFN